LTRQLLAFGRQRVGHEAVIDLREQLPELMELVLPAADRRYEGTVLLGAKPYDTEPLAAPLAAAMAAAMDMAQSATRPSGQVDTAPKGRALPAGRSSTAAADEAAQATRAMPASSLSRVTGYSRTRTPVAL
jgi:hypothetical protein